MLSKSRPLNPAARHPRHAFTMIEILVTIGIILVLIGILFVAVRGLFNSGKEHATHVTLLNLQAMLNDYGSSTGFRNEPANCVLSDFSVGTFYTSITTPPYTTSFWTAPTYTGTAPYTPLAIAAPANVNAGAGTLTDRMAAPEVMNTLVAMNMICRLPANRTAVANMPPQTLLVPTFVFGTLPTAGADALWQTSDDGTKTIVYPAGCHVQLSGKYYVSTTLNSDSAPTTTNWRDESAAPQQAPLILDAWGNPIIYVPSSGLNVMLLGGGTTYDTTNPNLKQQKITAPDNRPFWASAGPDGDFSRGDDNVYSFEQ